MRIVHTDRFNKRRKHKSRARVWKQLTIPLMIVSGVLLTRPSGSALADPPAVHLAILISYWSSRSDARSRTRSLPLSSGLILSHGSMTFPSEICRWIYG